MNYKLQIQQTVAGVRWLGILIPGTTMSRYWNAALHLCVSPLEVDEHGRAREGYSGHKAQVRLSTTKRERRQAMGLLRSPPPSHSSARCRLNVHKGAEAEDSTRTSRLRAANCPGDRQAGRFDPRDAAGRNRCSARDSPRSIPGWWRRGASPVRGVEGMHAGRGGAVHGQSSALRATGFQ